jgi:hypothetical protein
MATGSCKFQCAAVDMIVPEERRRRLTLYNIIWGSTFLCSQGVEVETSEERRVAKVAEIMREAGDGTDLDEIAYVLIPADSSKPLQELLFRPQSGANGDQLVDHLKKAFRGKSSQVDLSLLQQQGAQTLMGSGDGPSQVSDESLQKVAAEANVETFSLCQPQPKNKFTSIHIYLDEIGLLKRLPLNGRASTYAAQAGFNPPPQFYGDVFMGRVQKKPTVQNLSFLLGPDTAQDALWLRSATAENLEYQMEMNRITGRNDTQPDKVGDGKSKQEDGYSWTQTEEELEVTVSLPKDAVSKDVKAKFLPQTIELSCKKEKLLSIRLFEKVDMDGCTWTLDKSKKDDLTIVVTMEKVEQAFWPRIKD